MFNKSRVLSMMFLNAIDLKKNDFFRELQVWWRAHRAWIWVKSKHFGERFLVTPTRTGNTGCVQYVLAFLSLTISDRIYFQKLSLLQKLTTERTENTEYKGLMSKRILERFSQQNAENFVCYFVNFC